MTDTMKYWVSVDGQGQLGGWSSDIPDDEIIGELLDQCRSTEEMKGILAGRVVIGPSF